MVPLLISFIPNDSSSHLQIPSSSSHLPNDPLLPSTSFPPSFPSTSSFLPSQHFIFPFLFLFLFLFIFIFIFIFIKNSLFFLLILILLVLLLLIPLSSPS